MTLVAALVGAGVQGHFTKAADANIADQASASGVGGYVMHLWDTVREDPYSMRDAANTWRVRVPADGRYLLIAREQIEGSSAGTERRLRIVKNSSDNIGTGATELAEDSQQIANNRPVRLICTCEVRLSAGDTVSVMAWQDSGAARAGTKVNQSSPEFSVRRVGS